MLSTKCQPLCSGPSVVITTDVDNSLIPYKQNTITNDTQSIDP